MKWGLCSEFDSCFQIVFNKIGFVINLFSTSLWLDLWLAVQGCYCICIMRTNGLSFASPVRHKYLQLMGGSAAASVYWLRGPPLTPNTGPTNHCLMAALTNNKSGSHYCVCVCVHFLKYSIISLKLVKMFFYLWQEQKSEIVRLRVFVSAFEGCTCRLCRLVCQVDLLPGGKRAVFNNQLCDWRCLWCFVTSFCLLGNNCHHECLKKGLDQWFA